MQGLPDSSTKVKAFTVALNTDKSQTFFTVLRDFHILETLREPKKIILKMKKKKKKKDTINMLLLDALNFLGYWLYLLLDTSL